MFSNVNLNILNLMPFKISGELAVAGDRYLMWFGDFTPLLFIHVCKSPNRKKYMRKISASCKQGKRDKYPAYVVVYRR